MRPEYRRSAPLPTRGDRVAQVVSNLLNNAIKYAPEGPIEVTVRIENDQAVLAVRDHGPGIPEDRLRVIFEPNVRLTTGDSNGPSGSGLGLFIAKGIIEAHGGSIWAESPGYDERALPGSTFHIMVPMRSAPPGDELASLYTMQPEIEGQDIS